MLFIRMAQEHKYTLEIDIMNNPEVLKIVVDTVPYIPDWTHVFHQSASPLSSISLYISSIPVLL